MAKSNPLQQYFRQPKIYIDLPISKLYSKPGTIQSSEKMAVFGLTGMDEIILKTPDALLSGESVAKVIGSCCPDVSNPWELCNNDIDYVLTAIRIATYNNLIEVPHVCENCGAENQYDLDLSTFIEHFQKCQFDPKIVLRDLVIKIRPLTFKESNKFSLENFAIQKKSAQIDRVESDEERIALFQSLFEEMKQLQRKIMLESIDQIELPNVVVTEKSFINEYLDNCDIDVYDSIKKQFDANNNAWQTPKVKVKCSTCEHDDDISIEINQTTFFVGA